MATKTRKIGSGRTKGAVSSCLVSLKLLQSRLKPNSKVLVNRRWAKMLLLKGVPVESTTEGIAEMADRVAA